MTKQKLAFTDQQIQQANSINIIDYAKSRGYPVKQVTPHSYKIPGYGGLYIHSGGLKWNRFSADIGGGTIQFVMHMENKSWVEAIKELLDLPREDIRYSTEPEKQTEQEKKPFVLPEKNDTFKHMFAYLIGTRKIDKQLVYDLVKQNKIYENKYYNNCVFVGYDKNCEAKYAAVRGTNPSIQYRQDIAGSDKSYPFSANISGGRVCTSNTFCSNQMYVFESPIDLLSYLSLMKLHKINDFEAHCISLGGVSDLALERFLNEHPNIKEITLSLDNDEAGRFACEQIYKKYSNQYKINRHIPENKDFNEDLIQFKKLLQQEMLEKKESKIITESEVEEDEMVLIQ